jgi:hypothetical protein
MDALRNSKKISLLAVAILFFIHIFQFDFGCTTYNVVERILGIILRVLRPEVSGGFLKSYGRGYGFLSGFPSFSYTETLRGCASLKKLKSQGKAVEVTVNDKEENS